LVFSPPLAGTSVISSKGGQAFLVARFWCEVEAENGQLLFEPVNI